VEPKAAEYDPDVFEDEDCYIVDVQPKARQLPGPDDTVIIVDDSDTEREGDEEEEDDDEEDLFVQQ
jgi:hypothetical protein